MNGKDVPGFNKTILTGLCLNSVLYMKQSINVLCSGSRGEQTSEQFQ